MMNIQAISSQLNKTNPAFQAVNQKYLERAQREFAKRKVVTGDLFVCLCNDVYFGLINKIDALDTLNAIKEYTNKITVSWEQTKEFLEKFNP